MFMQSDYMPIVLLICVAALMGSAIVALSWLFGPKNPTKYKQSPYECGVTPIGTARERFPIKFYLVAILFILFDIEVVFLWSWLSVFKNAALDYQIFSFWAVMIYMVLWLVGDIYVLKMNAIDWDDETSVVESRSGILSEVDACEIGAQQGGVA